MPAMGTRKIAMTPDAFRELLATKQLTQAVAAEKLGVSRRTVIRWCAGDTRIDERSALLIRQRIGK